MVFCLQSLVPLSSRLSLEASFHHVGELTLDFVDGCLGGRLRGGFLHLLADGAEGLTGGSCGGAGSLVHAPPGFVMQPLKVSRQGGWVGLVQSRNKEKAKDKRRNRNIKRYGRKRIWAGKKRKRKKQV